MLSWGALRPPWPFARAWSGAWSGHRVQGPVRLEASGRARALARVAARVLLQARSRECLPFLAFVRRCLQEGLRQRVGLWRVRCFLLRPSMEPSRSAGELLLLDPGGLSDLIPDVVELGAPHVAFLDHLDVFDDGRMHRERALHADAERDLSDGERLARSRALPPDDQTLESLGARPHGPLFAGSAGFLDLDRDLYDVARLEGNNVLPHLASLDSLYLFHRFLPE